MFKDIIKENMGPLIIVLVVIVLMALSMYILPQYNVWKKELSGQADLKEAEWNRQIQIREAEANLESEKLNAQAEVERAKGMAEAMEIEGGALTREYIQYLWVRSNRFNDNTVIYVPTEANLPLLEALRLDK
jgi:predicted Holliday junction resolvase-like endonuclease